MLKARLSMIKLKEPGVRTPAFWTQCNNFIDAWAELGREIKRALDIIPLPADTKARLRPIQVSMKDTMDIILSSPWAYYIARNPGSGGGPGSPYGQQASRPPMTAQALPMTPQSAALGPAVQATVPSTPQSASFAGAFSGGVFERADALISMGGLHMTSSSRAGTMGTNTSSTSTSSSMMGSSYSTVSSNGSSSSSLLLQDGTTITAFSTGSLAGGSDPPLHSRAKYDPWGRSEMVGR
jgi:hypothetical protein